MEVDELPGDLAGHMPAVRYLVRHDGQLHMLENVQHGADQFMVCSRGPAPPPGQAGICLFDPVYLLTLDDAAGWQTSQIAFLPAECYSLLLYHVAGFLEVSL